MISKKLCLLWFITFSCCFASHAETQSLETVAGTGAPENNGDSGPASEINIGHPFGVEIGPDGALYITEVLNHRIRRLDLKAGNITTVAGCGDSGYAGDGGLAIKAQLNEPYEVRFDADGNMFFVEMKNHIIRRVDAITHKISTIAGSGKPGFGGDGGPAIKALLKQPHSIALGRDGAIYVADIGNHRIRCIDPQTKIIESIAGSPQPELPRDKQQARGNPILGPRALTASRDTLWIALREGHSIWRLRLSDGVLHQIAGTGKQGFAGDGGPALYAALNGPKGLAITSDGSLIVVDTENDAIRRIDLQAGTISTIVGGDPDNKNLARGRQYATLHRPHGVCVAPDGAIFIGDTLNHRVLRIRQ